MYMYVYMYIVLQWCLQFTAPPSSPRDVTLFVTSDRTLSVKFSEPESTNGSPVTRYKGKSVTILVCVCVLSAGYSIIVQWSRNERFVPESGEFVLCDSRKEITIPGLDKVMYFYCNGVIYMYMYSMFFWMRSFRYGVHVYVRGTDNYFDQMLVWKFPSMNVL